MNISRSKKRVYLSIGLGLIVIGLAVALAYNEPRQQDAAPQNDMQDDTTGQRTPTSLDMPSSDTPQAEPDSVDTPPVPKADNEEPTGAQPARVKEDAKGARQQ